MFKLVVFCALVAAVVADHGAIIATPYTQYSTVLAPASTTISKYDTNVIHPTQFSYDPAAPLAYADFIKKRSPQLPLGYYVPSTYVSPTSYIAPNHYLASAPLITSGQLLPAAAPISPAVHLIKKRSAPLLPAAYYAPQLYSAPTVPFLASSYAATAPLIHSTPLISHPITYTQFIKK